MTEAGWHLSVASQGDKMRAARRFNKLIGDVIDGQRGHLFLWSPVMFGLGIGLFFRLPHDPDFLTATMWMGGSLFLLVGVLYVSQWRWPVMIGLILMSFGCSYASFRSHLVAEPKLDYRYYGPVQGRVIAVDRSFSEKARVTLDQVILRDFDPRSTPKRVRVSLHGMAETDVPDIGETVLLTANISPPEGPSEPGGFDFQRHAWFLKLGAVGYTRTPVMLWEHADPYDFSVFVARLRANLSKAIQTKLPGDVGAVAAAITAGDRSEISRQTLDSLRASNLAHLLAISGLHMGLLSGLVFAAVRTGCVAFPSFSLRHNTKKIAAVVAMVCGLIYLILSGGAVATTRAFIMVFVMLLAVLADQRALTLRAVALAALIVLAITPQAILSPGFQMSFAATSALVVFFRFITDAKASPKRGWKNFVFGVVFSSAIAGLATAPYGAAHFNQISHYGLLANVLSVPVMGAIVMPAAIAAAILSLVGLEDIALWMMGRGLSWILMIADWVSGLPRALSFVPTPQSFVLPLITLGGLILFLWRGPLRLSGLAVMAAAILWWTQMDRPKILISGTGGLVGIESDAGRVLSKAKGDGFVAKSWLENDGDPVTQLLSSDRSGFEGERFFRVAEVEGMTFAHLTGKTGQKHFDQACATNDVVVTNFRAESKMCKVFDQRVLRTSGSLALEIREDGLRIKTARQMSGRRLWNQ